MDVDGADLWGLTPDGAVRSSWTRGGPVKRGWPHSCVPSAARTRPWPPPPAAFALYGRQEGGSGVSRARREFGVNGGEREEAAAAAGDLVGDGAEGLVTGVVAREVRGSGGGVGGFGWKRGLAPATSPPPKRRAVSSTRRFPPVSGREPAAPVVRSGGKDGSRVGASPSHGGFDSEEGVLLPDVLEKVVAANGGALVADCYLHGHGPKAEVGKASHASDGNAGLLEINGAGGFFGFVVDRGRGALSDQLGKKHLETLPVQGHELEEGEIADTLEITQGMIKNDALRIPIERQELEEGEIASTMENVEDMNKIVLSGHNLEEGKIMARATMDIVGVMVKEDLDGPVEGHELEEGLVTGVVAREVRGSGGGVGGFGWKRGLAPATSPPPKRRAVSSTRRFPPVSGREPAAPVVRSGGKDGSRVGASPSHGGFDSEEGVLLPDVLEKVVAANGGALVADCYLHGHDPKAEVGKASHASDGNAGLLEINGAGGFFGFVVDRGRGALSDQLGKKHLETLPVQGHELEEGEIADTLEITQGMIKNDALRIPIERQELEEGEIASTMENVEDMNKIVLSGHNLEEGKIMARATMDIVGVMVKEDLDGPVEGHESEKGENATIMEIAVATNKDTLYGSVEGQELEGEIATPLDIVETMNEDTLDGAVEVQKFEQGVIAATMDTVESMNNQALHGVVVVVKELEKREITAMDIVEGTNKDMFVGLVEDRELEDEIAAKGHGQEPDDSEIATKSGLTMQQSQFSVDVIPRDSTGGIIMRSKINSTARKTDHTVQQSQFSVDVIQRDSTSGIMRSKIKVTAGKTVQQPVKANHMSPLVTLDIPFSSASATTMKKFKEAQSKHVSINVASTSALASKEKHKFELVFVTKEKLKGKMAVYLEDDDVLKAVAIHEGKLELCLSVRSRVRSVCRHEPHGGQNTDRRRRVRMMCRRFHYLCRFLAQAVNQGSVELLRVDLAADQAIKKLPDYIKYRSIVGEVDGVEVGDEFLFRVELAIVGLHSPYRAGIDTTKDSDGELIAISIVASGGYLDEYSSSGELIYIGSGGKAAGTDQDGDQKLERGNLALKNCIERKIPVRVTHGFRTPNREEGSHSIGKEISKFIYDGLYHVVGFWKEGVPGSRVFKYRLRRIPGQPKLPLQVAKWLRKSVVRPR